MSYARYAAAAADVEALSGGARLQWKLRQAQAELRASLPFLGDDIFVLIAAELDARMLGRLGCAAQRFWRPSVPDPAHKGTGAPQLWSVAEEGARRRLAAQGEQVRGWVSRETSGGSWLRALRQAEPPVRAQEVQVFPVDPRRELLLVDEPFQQLPAVAG